jgi:xanthine dehydrogenase YagT iron-sulfur-binding subunit
VRTDDVAIPVLTQHDAQGELAERYGINGEQTLVLLDADGVVQWRHTGAITRTDERSLAASLLAIAESAPRDDMASQGWLPTRREFLAGAIAAAIVAAVAPTLAKAQRVADKLSLSEAPTAATSVTLNVNGRNIAVDIEPRVTLLDALREYAGLTGTKKGCDHGQCGACTVHINGRRQLSCMTFAVMQQGAKITTVEGLATGNTLHPMQTAFIKHDGFQCGYCTPGQLMSATALLGEPCGTADADVKECMSGNICRCGAYPGIVAAIQEVRSTARG